MINFGKKKNKEQTPEPAAVTEAVPVPEEVLAPVPETAPAEVVEKTPAPPKKKIKILLLTHKDSDNLGDQMIEICDYALLDAAMTNLGYAKDEYQIISEKAAIVTPEYCRYRDPAMLEIARKRVQEADFVMLGGAPQFNYIYQYFSERSVVFLELCKEYNKPIIFSGIGIENYDPEHPKCIRLKEALTYDCLRMVTTRDNLPDLKRIVTNPDVTIAQVADPAVVSGQVLRNCIKKKAKKIGLVMIRGNAFVDNGIEFTSDEVAKMWVDLIKEIEARGYDYELLTSGHFSDEQFMDLLVRNYGVKLTKCAFNMYTPDYLVEKLSSYAGVVSCRLHPSIISYSLKVPTVGVVWNPKVTGFYNALNYQDRMVTVDQFTPEVVMDKLEKAIEEGVEHDPEYLCSTYKSLFNILKKEFCPENEAAAYDYDELMEKLPTYPGTSAKEAEAKLRAQVRRCYKSFNQTAAKLATVKTELKALKKPNLEKYPIRVKYYTHGGDGVKCEYDNEGGKEVRFENGAHEYGAPEFCCRSYGTDRVAPLRFIREGYTFKGWAMRVKLHDVWFWVMEDLTLCMGRNKLWAEMKEKRLMLPEEGIIPEIPIQHVDLIIFDAVWEKNAE